MIDVVLELEAFGHRGEIHAVSRRGLLPRIHGRVVGRLPADFEERLATALDGRGLRHVLHAVRDTIRAAAARGVDWQAVIDALRPGIPGIWSALSPADRRRFVRCLRPYWEMHRHRVARSVAGQIAALQHQGRLTVVAGRPQYAASTPNGVVVELVLRDSMAVRKQNYAWIVNSTGSEFGRGGQRALESRLLER